MSQNQSGGKRWLAIVAGVALYELVPAQAQIRYSVTNVGLPGNFCTARSLSQAGHVGGVFTQGASLARAYVYRPGEGFSTFPELDEIGFTSQTSCAVNASGAVAVTASGYVDEVFTTRALVIRQGTVSHVPPLVGFYTDAVAINALGHVTGRSDAPLSALHAYLYDESGVRDLGQIEPPFGTNFRASAINDLDHVVGVGDNASGGTSGFLWDGAMNNLGPLQPAAINLDGWICGRAPAEVGFRAFVRSPDGSVTLLETLGGRSGAGHGINAAGEVVGTSQREDGSSAAFLWRDGAVLEVGLLLDRAALDQGWEVTSAEAINDAGQILGFSGQFPVLLTPHADCAADFNEDGGVDGADVDAFFAAWEAGRPLADVSWDGGVDGADVEAFFAVWSHGGC